MVTLTPAVVLERQHHTPSTDTPHGVAVLDVAQQQLLPIEGPCGGVAHLLGAEEPGAMYPRVTTARMRGNIYITMLG